MTAALYVSGPAYATDEPPAGAEKPAPHIALLLPLKSAVFGRAAEVVQQGFMAAANNQPLP
ncbi:MAG: penicillin-binding protein activator, partial [Betaproteobacteria bacterium]|nr:penicillin-binding protein activator [Betaproteobacteria bacterium]